MKNFRQYPYAVITFPSEGFIGIVGRNGDGKSTIFNAIGWAFYGKIKDVLKEDIKNTDAGPREECFVMLIFEHGGEDYVLKRHLTKSDECFLKTMSGRPLVSSKSSSLTNYITDSFFKMDYTTFCACFYAQQDDFDALSKMTPSKRKETLTRLLRIDMIDKATKKVKTDIEEHEKKVDKLEKVLTKETSLLEQIESAKSKIKEHKALIKTANDLLERLDENYKNLLVERAEGEPVYQQFLNFRNEYKQQLQQSRMLEERIVKQDEDTLQRLLKDEKQYDQIKSSIDEYNQYIEEEKESSQMRTLYQEKVSISNQLRDIKNEVETFKQEYASIQQDIQDEAQILIDLTDTLVQKETVVENMQITQTQVQEMNFEIRSLKDKLQQLKTTKEKFEQLGKESPCPTCERPLGEHYDETMEHIRGEQEPMVSEGRLIQEKRDAAVAEVENMKATLDKLAQAELSYNQKIHVIEKKKERMQFIQQQVNTLNQKYQQLVPRYQELKAVQFDNDIYNELVALIRKTKPLHDTALRIQHSLEQIPVVKERIQKNKEEIATIKVSLDNIEKTVKELNFDEAAFKSLTSQIETLQIDIHKEKQNVTKYTYEIKTFEDVIERNKEQLNEIKTARKEITEHTNEMSFLLKLVETYKNFKTNLIAELAPDLSQIMSDDIERITDGYYNEIELDEDFNIYLYRLGEKKPLNFYSGGEQKLAALLQLLGVSQLITEQRGQANFDMVAMDEVLSSFDDTRQTSTIEQLRNLKDVFPQVLMVAHQELVKDLFDYTLIVSTNEKRHSQVKWMRSWDDSEIQAMIEPFLAV